MKYLLTIALLILPLMAYCIDGEELTEKSDKQKERMKQISWIDEDFNPDENLKPTNLTFNFGGTISAHSRIKFKDFELIPAGGFKPIPNELWFADVRMKLWGSMAFKGGSYLQIGVTGMMKVQDNSAVNLVPLFTIDSLFAHVVYPLGSVVFGRSIYKMHSSMIFSGPLDAIELNISVPYLNFKTFTGFSGLLGIFHPWFNPYTISSADRSYVETSNLLTSGMSFQLNAPQSRRIFFAIDADIHFFSQHINPYFLLQYDLQSIFQNMDTQHDLNTFHLGLNTHGKIAGTLFYKLHFSGLFGTHPSSSGTVKPILAFAFESYLRYVIPRGYNSTFQIGYAIGSGNSEKRGNLSNAASDSDKGFWSDKYDGEYQNKFYYYGRFDGGFVLNPILSNIHSISFRYSINPFKNSTTDLSLYGAFYQTFKVHDTGCISDDDATETQYPVASEFNMGMLLTTNSFTLTLDAGIMIPLSAYKASDSNPRTRLGAVIAFTF